MDGNTGMAAINAKISPKRENSLLCSVLFALEMYSKPFGAKVKA